MLVTLWKGFGYYMMIFLAGLQAIPESFYEAARIDGANWWPTWQLAQGNTLPQLVRITVGFRPDPEQLELRDEMEIVEEDFLQNEEEIEPLAPDRYSIVVRLKQADVNLRGIVFNDINMQSQRYGAGRYSYQYSYQGREAK